jgi:hypothetical protein
VGDQLAGRPEFSVFLRATALISSPEAVVSSNEAACAEAPCASNSLEVDTCLAALAICFAPARRSPPSSVNFRLTPPDAANAERLARTNSNPDSQDSHCAKWLLR